MAVEVKIYQSNRKGNTNGKFYGRATHRDTVDIKAMAATMQNNSTVKYSDIVAVLAELSEVMRLELLRGNRVKLDGIGTFKVGVHTKAANSAKEFNMSDNVVGTHILFLPETSVDASGTRVKSLLAGVKVREASAYESLKAKEKAEQKTNDADTQADTQADGAEAVADGE